ncbi:hypothetical protein ABH922_002082 [Rhodococcus sp. 27YEA15]|uniref:hypothetical protein n=1 Tax=Rhodococcus sp. 27YEA15 TaxID=3156259 RepID=UPI003C7C9446
MTVTLTTQHAEMRAFDDSSNALSSTNVRLRALNPDYPRVYAVATMANEGKRRWWQLEAGLQGERVQLMFVRSLQDLDSAEAAAVQVATSLIHAVVGRVTASLVLEGSAWDAGLENLWIHMDSDGGIDWAGVVDETLRVAPSGREFGGPGVVDMPCEEALLVWTAHRCLTSLRAIYEGVSRCGPLDAQRFWGLVGEAVLGATAYVPILAGGGESAAQRRGQGLLDAFASAGLPVRLRRRVVTRPRWNQIDEGIAKLGQPCL